MRIGHSTNGRSCEYEMQDMFKYWLREKCLRFIDEFNISQIKRIPDFLIFKPGNGLINVEAKCNAFECLLDQLDDNSVFCNYSFAYITDICLTPVWFKKRLIDSGYGLIVYNTQSKIITEVLEAHQNKNFDKDLNKIVVSRIEKELILRKKAREIDTQKALDIFNNNQLEKEGKMRT